jgi:hypothetical protein
VNSEKEVQVKLRLLQKNLSKLVIDETRAGNSLWYSLIRHLITLSSSFLVVTIAVVEKVFPRGGEFNEDGLPLFLIIGWVGYFCTIVFGIFTEINEVIFHQNSVKEKNDLLQEIIQKISKGEEVGFIKNDGYKSNSIFFGVSCINLFIVSTAFLCVSLLKQFISDCTSWLAIVLLIFALIWINIFFIKKTKSLKNAKPKF